MAITDINISEQLETGAPSIRYEGNEGPQPSPQYQQEMQIAQQIWEALDPEQQGQFQSFEQFFQSGIWKQILQQMQADEGRGPETQQGIGSLGPQPMEQQMPMPNRMGAEYGGRIGFQQGLGTSLHGDDKSALMKEVYMLMQVLGLSKDEAIQRATSQSEGSFPRPEIRPFPIAQEPLRSGPLGMTPPEEFEQVGIGTLRGNI